MLQRHLNSSNKNFKVKPQSFLFYDVSNREKCASYYEQALNFLLRSLLFPCGIDSGALKFEDLKCSEQIISSWYFLSYGTSFCSRTSKIDFIAKFLLVLLSRNNQLNHALVRDVVDNACHPFQKIILFIFGRAGSLLPCGLFL